jgi:hypothetical protein
VDASGSDALSEPLLFWGEEIHKDRKEAKTTKKKFERVICHPERTREGSGLGFRSQDPYEYVQDDIPSPYLFLLLLLCNLCLFAIFATVFISPPAAEPDPYK